MIQLQYYLIKVGVVHRWHDTSFNQVILNCVILFCKTSTLIK